MFREINITKLTLLYLRQYWSFTSSNVLSIAYKYIYSCLYFINLPWQQYDIQRNLYNIKARQTWQLGSLMAYLKYYFDDEISYRWVEYSGAVWFADSVDGVMFSHNVPVNFSAYLGVTSYKQLWFLLPSSIYDNPELLAEFSAEISLLCPSGVTYSIDCL